MNQGFSIVCLTYSEIENQIPFITNSYNNGKYVHFLNVLHQNMNCSLTLKPFGRIKSGKSARFIKKKSI